MNTKSYYLQHYGQRSLVVILIVIALITSSYVALPPQQRRSPVFVIDAPGQVEVGDRIEIQLIVDHARDLAGYEAQLLFDPSAAHFSGLHQRDSDLKKFGRDVIPLEATELPEGVALGLASCPFTDCVEMNGNPQTRGANGRVRLGTVLIGTDQEGLLELSFEHLKFVDANGNVLAVEIPQTRISVQVGQNRGVSFPAPASSWDWSVAPSTTGNFDITGEGQVNYADATETAFEWKLGREQGQPCGPANDLSRDVNGDNCIDVIDTQLILANTSNSGPRSQAPGPANAKGPSTSADAQTAAAVAQAVMTSTFIVNSTSDAADSNIGDGICSSIDGCTLRAAINEANSHFGPDTILFNIPGSGVQTIQLGSRLPSLFDGSGGTTIDGYSQPGSQPNTSSSVSNAVIMIEIRGTGPSTFDAMLIQSAGNRVQGLAFFNMRRSIWVSGSAARNNFIVGNFIGTNATATFGLTAQAPNAVGVHIQGGATGNHVGGTSPADRNVISGNASSAIDFKSQGTSGNLIMNNLIGPHPSGTIGLLNMRHGIDINSGASNNIVGGTGAGQRNIVSSNAYQAIEISHDTLTSGNQVIGNCIGTEPSCNAGPSWAKNRQGIHVQDGVNNNIIAHNVIGNNPTGGIKITGSGTNRNQVYENRIGISLNNTSIPNGFFGIEIARATKFNDIGPNNIIANNPVGVRLLDDGTDQHKITRNSIFNNLQFGIDLGPTANLSTNDSGDGDIGPNEGLNWPILESATTSQVTGTACAEASVPKPCTIEIFIAERRTSDAGAGNYGQGKTLVGSGTTNSDGSFTVSISGVIVGSYLTATATDASGNTSEFSQNILVSEGGSTPTSTPTSTPPTATPTPTGELPTPTITPTHTATPPGTTIYAFDPFTRNVTNSWGSANSGGSYTLTGTASDFNVNGSAGTMVVPAAGGARVAKLQSVSVQDLTFLFRVKTDKLAAGNNLAAIFIARGVSSSSEYRCQVRMSTTNTVHLRAFRLVNGTQTALGTEITVSGLTHSADSYIWVRGEVVGTNPTAIRIKAWADGQPEPAGWQYTVTDLEPSLQAAGAVGVRSILGAGVTNAPVMFTYDDLSVTSP